MAKQEQEKLTVTFVDLMLRTKSISVKMQQFISTLGTAAYSENSELAVELATAAGVETAAFCSLCVLFYGLQANEYGYHTIGPLLSKDECCQKIRETKMNFDAYNSVLVSANWEKFYLNYYCGPSRFTCRITGIKIKH